MFLKGIKMVFIKFIYFGILMVKGYFIKKKKKKFIGSLKGYFDFLIEVFFFWFI